MTELLQTAWIGWVDYIQKGKFAALLWLALLYLWLGKKWDSEGTPGTSLREADCALRIRRLFLYTALTAGCCMFPVTAMILLKYQTAFYSYVWIWSAVPMTLTIAYAGADFLAGLLKNSREGAWKQNRKAVSVFLLLLAIVVLSGNPAGERDGTQTAKEREHAAQVLDALLQCGENKDAICLWAPKEIMAAARAQSGDLRLVYGRSIWDASLGAYSYETYAPWQEELYLWMSNLEEQGTLTYERDDHTVIRGEACVQRAFEEGVTAILLPGDVEETVLTALEAAAGTGAEELQGYYLLWNKN